MKSQDGDIGQLLEVSGNYWQTCTLHTAVKLDVFTLIGDDKIRGEAFVKRLDGDSRGVIMLLNALAAMGLLEKEGDLYSNTETSKTLLVKGSRKYIGYIVMHHHHLVEAWFQLDRAGKFAICMGCKCACRAARKQ